MNAPTPAEHLLPHVHQREVPAACIDALRQRFGERCSTALAVSEQQSDRILDWPAERSEAVLAELCARLYAADNVVSHEWRTGDLVVWDNLALQHGRPAITGPGERTLRRVAMVLGDPSAQHAWTRVSLAAEGKGR